MKRSSLLRATHGLVSVSLIGASVLGALACQSADTRELGYTDDAQDLNLSSSPPTAPFVGSISDFTGRWIGEAEETLALGLTEGEAPPAFRFPSGSTQISLEFLSIEDGYVDGVVTFGAGTPPPPPLDPDLGYPTDVDYGDVFHYFTTIRGAFSDSRALVPYEGFAYAFSRQDFISSTPDPADAQFTLPDQNGVADGVLRVQLSTNEILKPWCELQTPHEFAGALSGYGCAAGGVNVNPAGTCDTFTGGPPTSECPLDDPESDLADITALSNVEYKACFPDVYVDTVDCNKYLLCYQNRCSCDADSCYWDFHDSLVSLSLRRNGDELIGVFEGAVFLNERGLRVAPGTVRFRPAP